MPQPLIVVKGCLQEPKEGYLVVDRMVLCKLKLANISPPPPPPPPPQTMTFIIIPFSYNTMYMHHCVSVYAHGLYMYVYY